MQSNAIIFWKHISIDSRRIFFDFFLMQKRINKLLFIIFEKKIVNQGRKNDEDSAFTAAVKLSVESSWIGTILYIVPWNPTI